MNYLNKNLLYNANKGGNGVIYKSECGKLTVTLYKSTNVLHLQGSLSHKWCAKFVSDLKQLNVDGASNDSSLTDPKLIISQPTMSSTPIRDPLKNTCIQQSGDECTNCNNYSRVQELTHIINSLKVENDMRTM